MSRIFVANDADTTRVEIFQMDEGHAIGVCEGRDWTTDVDRRDSLHDVIEEAGIHMDLRH